MEVACSASGVGNREVARTVAWVEQKATPAQVQVAVAYTVAPAHTQVRSAFADTVQVYILAVAQKLTCVPAESLRILAAVVRGVVWVESVSVAREVVALAAREVVALAAREVVALAAHGVVELVAHGVVELAARGAALAAS